MKTVYLVRHGESTENVRTDTHFRAHEAELTDAGRRQAAAVAERAKRLPIETIISSTMRRAQDTAQAISDATGVSVESSDLFVERLTPASFLGGSWEDAEFVARFRAWERTFFSDEGIEDGENFPAIQARARAALRYLEERPESNLLVVTHGFFLRVLVGTVMLRDTFDADDMQALYESIITRNTGITVLQHRGDYAKDGWGMLTWNDHAHLG